MTKILGVQYLLPPIVLVEICPRFKLKGFLCEGGGGGGVLKILNEELLNNFELFYLEVICEA